jgi:hypothetical protein
MMCKQIDMQNLMDKLTHIHTDRQNAAINNSPRPGVPVSLLPVVSAKTETSAQMYLLRSIYV